MIVIDIVDLENNIVDINESNIDIILTIVHDGDKNRIPDSYSFLLKPKEGYRIHFTGHYIDQSYIRHPMRYIEYIWKSNFNSKCMIFGNEYDNPLDLNYSLSMKMNIATSMEIMNIHGETIDKNELFMHDFGNYESRKHRLLEYMKYSFSIKKES